MPQADRTDAPIDAEVRDALAAIDLAALRAGRLARLQRSMIEHGVDACLFFKPANVRYATGTSVMTVYCLDNFVRCALVPAAGEPILYEHPEYPHVTSRIVRDVRVMHTWEYMDDEPAGAGRWADQMLEGLRDLGVAEGRVGIDRISASAFLALGERDVAMFDSGGITLDARAIKTPEELALLRLNGRIAHAMLARLERELAAGVRERDLLAAMTDELLRRGGEFLITRAVVSGPNTNPWSLEATDRSLEEGDLVFADTDAIGIEGYFADVSRTFLVGDVAPTPAQRDAYRAAHDWLAETRGLLRPGMTMGEFARIAPRLPERYRAQRYECMAHSAGLEDEGPSINWPEDQQPNPDRPIEAGMVLCLEVYCGEVGARDGVKLEDQVEITEDGCVVQAPHPFADTLR